jgi:hypothetical protein
MEKPISEDQPKNDSTTEFENDERSESGNPNREREEREKRIAEETREWLEDLIRKNNLELAMLHKCGPNSPEWVPTVNPAGIEELVHAIYDNQIVKDIEKQVTSNPEYEENRKAFGVSHEKNMSIIKNIFVGMVLRDQIMPAILTAMHGVAIKATTLGLMKTYYMLVCADDKQRNKIFQELIKTALDSDKANLKQYLSIKHGGWRDSRFQWQNPEVLEQFYIHYKRLYPIWKKAKDLYKKIHALNEWRLAIKGEYKSEELPDYILDKLGRWQPKDLALEHAWYLTTGLAETYDPKYLENKVLKAAESAVQRKNNQQR